MAGRTEVQSRLKGELTERLTRLTPRGIIVKDMLLKNVWVLPDDLSNSIQEKARTEQE